MEVNRSSDVDVVCACGGLVYGCDCVAEGKELLICAARGLVLGEYGCMTGGDILVSGGGLDGRGGAVRRGRESACLGLRSCGSEAESRDMKGMPKPTGSDMVPNGSSFAWEKNPVLSPWDVGLYWSSCSSDVFTEAYACFSGDVLGHVPVAVGETDRTGEAALDVMPPVVERALLKQGEAAEDVTALSGDVTWCSNVVAKTAAIGARPALGEIADVAEGVSTCDISPMESRAAKRSSC